MRSHLSPISTKVSDANIRLLILYNDPNNVVDQYYCINLTDTDGYDGVVTSTLTITFHEESHRRLTANYWRFWLGQQQDPQSARALDLSMLYYTKHTNNAKADRPPFSLLALTDVERSSGIYNVQCPEFDRVVFEWNGKRGATIHVRFNCLSTDFSRIKGVKGIPLRLHMETQIPSSTSAGAVTTPSNTYSEATYCKIKLFRDKASCIQELFFVSQLKIPCSFTHTHIPLLPKGKKRH